MHPKISVIIPVYNVEKYIDCCLESITHQTLNEIEIILVDDGSTDTSSRKCEEWKKKDSRIKVIHKANEGLGLTRNAGLREATGEYVAFCDSDDYVNNEMYEKMYFFSKTNNLDVCYCNYVLDNNGVINKKSGSPLEQHLYIGKKEVDEFLLDMIGPLPDYPSDVKYMVSSCMALYRRGLIQKHNVRFMCERVVLSEDTLFNFDFLVHANNVGYLPEQFYYYRYNPQSLSRTYNHKKADTFIKFLQEIKKRLDTYYHYNKYRIHYQRMVFYVFRILIKYESIMNINNQRIKFVKMRASDPLLEEVYREYPYYKFPLLKRIFFFCMKKKFVRMLILMSVLENYKRKNI